jgi:ankyrin repeat protein
MVTLLKRNVSVNFRDSLGNLPVHYSCIQNNVTSLKLLSPLSAMN